MSKYRLVVAVFEGVGHFVPKFHIEEDVPHQAFFMLENKMHRTFMWYKNVDRSFFRFVTIHAFDRRTDRCSSQDRGCIAAAR